VRASTGRARYCRLARILGVAAILLALISPAAMAEFGVAAFDAQLRNAEGGGYAQAGGHPYSFDTTIRFNTITHPTFGPRWPTEPVKDVVVDLPPGLLGNPQDIPRCEFEQLMSDSLHKCDVDSQVGTARVLTNILPFPDQAVYNMVPPPNVPARLGINFFGTPVVLDVKIRSGSDYGVSVVTHNVSEGLPIIALMVSIWGVPGDRGHDALRHCDTYFFLGCDSGLGLKPFLINTTSCPPAGSGTVTRVGVTSWFHPEVVKTASVTSHEPPGLGPDDFASPSPRAPEQFGPLQGPEGCATVPFKPTVQATPTPPGRAGMPSGFDFEVTLPQDGDNRPTTIAESHVRRAIIRLPEGVRVSPPSADGLDGCAPEEITIGTEEEPVCPGSSKVARVRIDTPVLDGPLEGSMYLATPHKNPSSTLLGLYLVAHGPGVTLKLPGRVDTDPETGQLTATFDNLPQLPFSKLHVEFDDGPHAPLVTPPKCGTYTTHAVLTGWNGKTVTSDSSFTISRNSRGEACSPLGFSPDLEAGMDTAIAGADGTFGLQLTRHDDDEELDALSVALPQGLLAHIRNVPLCKAALAAAGTCPESTRVGTVQSAAGAGAAPFWLPGRAYLGGPYKGAPFSLSVVVPAVAGPFDLGTVVVRSALRLDRRTAILRAVTDPLPRILEGIPLQIRALRVEIDRKHFTLNPTNCAPKRVRATVSSVDGSVARPSARFQVTGCNDLGFTPRMRLIVGGRGHTAAGARTPLTATLSQPAGQANLSSAEVTLPPALNARLDVITDACTPEEFQTGHCEEARAGTAVATTRLLKKPLRGAAYFVKQPAGQKGLPNLVVALRGQVDFDLYGDITTPGGFLRTTFASIPDVAVKSFTLKLQGGKRGSVGTVYNLCSAKGRHNSTAHLELEGQNGKRRVRNQPLVIKGCGRRG
jgi:hypothetical protein